MIGQRQVLIRTADGNCPTYVLIPDGNGLWPAVIVYMDALGMRSAMVDVGKRLAESGYLTLVPNLFYRSGDYQIPTPEEAFAGGDLMKVIGPFMAVTGPEKAAQDTSYFLEYATIET